MESVEAFETRARKWMAENMPPAGPEFDRYGPAVGSRTNDEDLALVARCRELQRRMYDGGFAGICVPEEYGGQGLTPEHQAALNRAVTGYEFAAYTQMPTFTPCMAVILDFGTEEQKRKHVPAILKGEEMWMQLLSEPSSGSDVAGALTTAIRDGDEWIVNGSKIWTSGAWWADWGLILARTNWDVPKHRGLSVFMVDLRAPGVEIHRIEMLNGSREFCQEFLTDVRIPDSDRIGDVDQGWTVGVRWMYHERTVSGGSPYVTMPVGRRAEGSGAPDLVRRMREAGRFDRPDTKQLIGEYRANELVRTALTERIADQIRSGAVSDQSAAIIRLFGGLSSTRNMTIAFELSRSTGAAWDPEVDDITGIGYLMRQVSCIGGGTTEMSRNVISERVLGMPRERTLDREVPFREVPRGG